MTAALLLALALPAAGQSPMPFSGEAPAASTAPAVSTAAVAVEASTVAVKTADAPKPRPARTLHALIHADAKDWEPVSLKAGGDARQTEATLRLEKVKNKYVGTSSKAKASARLHAFKKESWLTLSVFPQALAGRRRHFEVRLKIVGNYVEDVKAGLITVTDRRADAGAGLDSFELGAAGVAFEEDTPGSAEIIVSALDPRPSKSALNAGVLKHAAFAAWDVRLADVSWSATGLPAPR